MSHPKEENKEDYGHRNSHNEAVKSETGNGKLKCEEDVGEVISSFEESSAPFYDTQDDATESVDDQVDFSHFIKIKATLERNNKVIDTMSKLFKPTYDSDEEVPVVPNEEEEVEWVTGEVGGYKYRVRKEEVEAGKRMNYFELLEDICIRKERIAMKLARNNKAIGALTGFAKKIDDADWFVPSASMSGNAEADISK